MAQYHFILCRMKSCAVRSTVEWWKAIDICLFFFFFWRRLPKWQLWLSSTFKESYKRCSLSNQGRLCLCLARSFFFSSFVCFYKYKLAVNKLPYWSGDLKCFFFSVKGFCVVRLKQFTTTNTWLQKRGVWEYRSRVACFGHLNFN